MWIAVCPEQLLCQWRCLSISTLKKTWTKARVGHLPVGECMDVLNLIIFEYFLKINFPDQCLRGPWGLVCLGWVVFIWRLFLKYVAVPSKLLSLVVEQTLCEVFTT